MKSQQVKCLLSACNPLFLFTPCRALIDLSQFTFLRFVLSHCRKESMSCYLYVRYIIPFMLVEDLNSTALRDVKLFLLLS